MDEVKLLAEIHCTLLALSAPPEHSKALFQPQKIVGKGSAKIEGEEH